MFEITKIPLPVEAKHDLSEITRGWQPLIVGLSESQVIARLEQNWSKFEAPYLRQLCSAILSKKLTGLSIDDKRNEWLSFEGQDFSLHLYPPAEIPSALQKRFPFGQIPGLTDFLQHFSGMADVRLPPCPWFTPVMETRIVTGECDRYDWGRIGPWEGSLPLYNTTCGNFFVISPQNRCAFWDHDIGWGTGEKDPFQDLGWSMSTFINEYLSYLALDEAQAKNSIFYW